MNLRVNLIADNERRSSSFVTPQFFFSLLGVLITLALVVFFGGTVLTNRRDAATLQREQWVWERAQTSFAKANTVAARLKVAETFMGDVKAWRASCCGWNDRMTLLAHEIPDTLQLIEMRLQSPVKDGPEAPKIASELRLSGRTSSPTAASDVARLRDIFTTTALSNGVAKATIPPDAFRQDPTQQDNTDARIFEIVCTYLEKPL